MMGHNTPSLLSTSLIHELAIAAWQVRDKAIIFGTTKVGCAIVTRKGDIFLGCNIEHPFRSHDVHAEVNALSSMVASGGSDPLALVIVAERQLFTPCGACMDWIMHLGSHECMIFAQSQRNGEMRSFTAKELMPYYPI